MDTRIYHRHGDQELTADIFRPAGPQRSLPCLGFFHGGGWAFGSPSEFHAICAWFAARGYLAISFSYRLCRTAAGVYPHPDITPVESTHDARLALRWLHGEAADLGIDPRRIVLGGQSAGGQLALATVLCDGLDAAGPISPPPRGFLLYSSNYNTVEAWLDNLLGERRGEIWSISSHHNLRPGLPPMCAFHGGRDAMVPPYVVDLFKARTESLGNRYELHSYPEREHYLGAPDRTYATLVDEEILERSLAFLRGLG